MSTSVPRRIARRVRIRQIDGDDGYQWCLTVDGQVTYTGMTRSEAEWRRQKKLSELATDDRPSS